MGFTSGRYTATWNNLALGQTADGFRVSHSFMKRLIAGDKFGEAAQDAVIRGMDVSVEMRLIEFDAAAIQTLINPYSSGYTMGSSVGKLDVGSSFVKSLVLTAVDVSPGPLPATLTLYQTILHEGFPVTLLHAPDLREVPIRLRAYPGPTGSYSAGS
jgi:hypothetical protein